MAADLRSFWDRFQTGIEVAVGSGESHKLLGTRDAFLRYFREGLRRQVSIALVPHAEVEMANCLPMTDEEAIAAARGEAKRLEDELGDAYHFYVANEGNLHPVEVDGTLRYFVRSWTVVRCALGESWGGSGSVQLPESLVDDLDGRRRSLVMPGRRRGGGLLQSLTGGMETRRSAVETATLNALATIFYGTMEARHAVRAR